MQIPAATIERPEGPRKATLGRKRRPNLKLQELRVNRGLSPNELGALVGRVGKTIRLAEAGFIPTPAVQFDIASFFELRPTDIWPINPRGLS